MVNRTVLSIRIAKNVAVLMPGRAGPLPSPYALALALLVAHHPAATYHSAPLSTWRNALHLRGGPATVELMGRCADAISRTVLGAEGLLSSHPGRRASAAAAAGTCLALAPAPFYVHVSHSLRTLLDTSDHDELTKDELAIFRTPLGKLSTEMGGDSFIPQFFNESAPRARSRFLDGVEVTTDMLMEQQAIVSGARGAVSGPAPVQQVRASIAMANPGAKPKQLPAGKPDPREEKRLTMLAEEAVVRRGVAAIKDRLDRGLELAAVSSVAAPRFTCVHLDELSALVQPLLSSTLVGDSTAFHACAALAKCLPAPLGGKAFTLTSALRLVQLNERNLQDRSAVQDSIAVLTAATNIGSRPSSLSSSIYRFLFPLGRAILMLPAHCPLHDPALAFVALHVMPGQDVPRTETMRALANVLGTVPATRDRVSAMMEALCRGMTEEDLAASVGCVLSPHATVRGVVLRALSQMPLLADAMCPERDDVVSVLWLCCYDVEEVNADVARDLWLSSGAALSPNFVASLVDHLSSEHKDVRAAAARALSDALLEDMDRAGEALGYVILHGSRSDCSVHTRAGCVEAVGAISTVISDEDALVALDYLLVRAMREGLLFVSFWRASLFR